MKVGDLIVDTWLNEIAIILDMHIEPPNLEFQEECLMLLALYSDESVHYVEAADAEVINEIS